MDALTSALQLSNEHLRRLAYDGVCYPHRKNIAGSEMINSYNYNTHWFVFFQYFPHLRELHSKDSYLLLVNRFYYYGTSRRGGAGATIAGEKKNRRPTFLLPTAVTVYPFCGWNCAFPRKQRVPNRWTKTMKREAKPKNEENSYRKIKKCTVYGVTTAIDESNEIFDSVKVTMTKATSEIVIYTQPRILYYIHSNVNANVLRVGR